MDNGWLNRSQFLFERTELENLHLKVVDTLGFNPDIIILDPPRDGIHLKAIAKDTGIRCQKNSLYFLQAYILCT